MVITKKEMKSFKDLLRLKIEKEGYVSYGDIAQFSVEEGYKVETATRRLRGLCADKSEQGIKQIPQIKAITAMSKRNTEYIAAYQWKERIIWKGFTEAKNPSKDFIVSPIPEIKIGGIRVPIFAPKKEKKEIHKETNQGLGI